MLDFKTIIGVAAVALTFIGYIPYFRDIFNGKTTPHLFSWFIWILTSAIIYALQVASGAGPGAWVTLSLVIIMTSVFVASLKKGDRDIKKIDIVFLIVALLALPLWLIVKQPILSIIILTTIDLIGFLPTIRKSWNRPRSETLSFYLITTFRHSISVLALRNYNIVTALYPVAWVAANAIFSVILIIRRRKITQN